MNKYLLVLVVMCISLGASANSYVFGGRAHFNGVLVNSACAFVAKDDQKYVEQTQTEWVVEFNVSSCISTVYQNLAVVLQDVNKMKRVSASQAESGKPLYLMPELNLHHLRSQEAIATQTSLGTAVAERHDELTNIDETVALPLASNAGQVSQNSPNILLSVVYP